MRLECKQPSQRDYRDTIGLFTTGVAVIVASIRDEVSAMTVNAVSSLSLDPMLVMFAPGKHTRFALRIEDLQHYSINILRSEQQALSTYFAGGWKGSAPPFRFVPEGHTLRLEGCLTCLECEKVRHIEVGDHWCVIGHVRSMRRGVEPHKPLLFYQGRYRDIDFSHASSAPDLADAHDVPAHIYYPP
jgi:flavin reductase (DIM6/NTAB) family NADH-FMN oxidoreductase RutF